MQHAFGIGQILEDHVGSAGLKIGDRIVSSGNRNRSGIDAVAAGNVGGGIADNDDRVSSRLLAEVAGGPLRGDGWQVGPMGRIRPVGSDLKSAGIDSRGPQLEPGSLEEIAGKKSQHHSWLRLEPLE